MAYSKKQSDPIGKQFGRWEVLQAVERTLTEPYHEAMAIHTPRPRENWHRPKPPKPPSVSKPRPKVTHCKYGHSFDDANTYHTSAGKRQCRTCNKARREAAKPPSVPKPPMPHCKRGHLFDGSNTFIDQRGNRNCRACRQISRRALKERLGHWL